MHGYLHEFLCDLRGLSKTIARTDPASLDWATHKLERIDRILAKHGVRSEEEQLGAEPIPAGPDGTPEYEETILLYYFDHFRRSADSTLRWSLRLYGYERRPVEAEVLLAWDRRYANETDSPWETLRGSGRRWIHHLGGRSETPVSKRRAFEIVDQMAARMAAIKGIPKPH